MLNVESRTVIQRLRHALNRGAMVMKNLTYSLWRACMPAQNLRECCAGVEAANTCVGLFGMSNRKKHAKRDYGDYALMARELHRKAIA
jgi:hypothetical protein